MISVSTNNFDGAKENLAWQRLNLPLRMKHNQRLILCQLST